MPYFVLHWRGGSIYRKPLDHPEVALCRRDFVMSLIQRDVSGTEHWELFGLKPKRPKRKVNTLRAVLAGAPTER